MISQVGVTVQPVSSDWLIRPTLRAGAVFGPKFMSLVWDDPPLFAMRHRMAPTIGLGFHVGGRVGAMLTFDWGLLDKPERYRIVRAGSYFRF